MGFLDNLFGRKEHEHEDEQTDTTAASPSMDQPTPADEHAEGKPPPAMGGEAETPAGPEPSSSQ